MPLFYPGEDQPPPMGFARVVSGPPVLEAALLRHLSSAVRAG